MSAIELQKTISDGGLRSINFFNGRLLTARDLSQEQAVNREALRRLGQALGSGVVEGLEVFKSPTATAVAPVVTVEPGLAVNQAGQALLLGKQIELTLARPAGAATGGASIFVTCQPPQTGTYVAGAGAYVLTIAPAEVTEGRAQASGLSGNAACGTDVVVEGVQFRLLQLNVTPADLSDAAHLRNRLAYKCFGADDPRAVDFLRNPFGKSLSQYGLIDDLRATCLKENETPLAVIYWTTSGGIVFIDRWAARRRVTRPAATERWPWFVSDRRVSEAEATFLQFEEQLREIRETESNLPQIVATDRFDYLPPVGLLPSIGVGVIAAPPVPSDPDLPNEASFFRVGEFALNLFPVGTVPTPGFDYRRFFDGQAYHPPAFIEGAMVDPLIRLGLPFAPINLRRNDPIKLFQIVDSEGVRPYLLFVSAFVPFHAEARFDVMRWNFTNFA